MPCHITSHTHNWPRSGTLSISECESKCGFCTSNKDYKPASALRKHVLTHIRDDEMPLTLEKSMGGRPRLQIASIVSEGHDQPGLTSSTSEGLEPTIAALPVLGSSHTEKDRIDINDNILHSLGDLAHLESNIVYSIQVASITANVKSEIDAVYLLKRCGSEQTLARRALDHLNIRLIEIQYIDLFTWLDDSRNDYQWFWDEIQRGYMDLLGAIKDVQPSVEFKLYLFYALMVMSIIQGILQQDSESIPGALGPEVTKDGSSTTGLARPSNRPLVIVLEEADENLHLLFHDLYGIHIQAKLRPMALRDVPPGWNFVIFRNVGPDSDITDEEVCVKFVGVLRRFESKVGLALTGLTTL